ncbi:MAG: hypothetical protein DRH24_15370 [Deltaproteobacteria bacterium]|nr:MAG: hypothetical protein DRH24_15370 [Deltaproteobacteria bacterium]
MPAKQTIKKQTTADNLKVYKISETQYFVESSKEKILYKVNRNNGTDSCTCADYTVSAQKNVNYQCKHIQAALNGNVQNMNAHSKPRLNDQFIITIKGSDFVKYAGLLDLAHQKGIQMIKVEPVQFPTKENKMEAICKATLEAPNGDIFIEIGDANPVNVNKMVVNHILRIAATRAKARCLRDYTNVGITCLEELGGDDIPEMETKPKRNYAKNTAKPVKPAGEVIPMKQQKKSPPPKQAENLNQQAQEQFGTKQSSTATQKQSPDTPKPSQAQKRAIESLGARRGLNLEDLDQLCQKTLGVEYEYLSASDAAQFIKTLQQSG